MLKKLFCSTTILLAVLLVSLVPKAACAQSGTDSSDISVFLGSMLPNQIDGVTEILPMFGGRYGLGTRIGTIEAELSNSHAEGVDFTTVGLSIRGDIPVGDGLIAAIYGGVDWNYYIPKNASVRQSENGLHFGGAAMLLVSSSLWLRTDLKLMGGPGTSLWLTAGLEFRGFQ